jgi:hypothetical protein
MTFAGQNHTDSIALDGRRLVFEETFEEANPFSTVVDVENCRRDYALEIVTHPVFQGYKAARFEIRKDQPLVGSSKKVRSEVTIFKGDDDDRFTREMWYSYSIYFPSIGLEYDDESECINEWLEDGSDETNIEVELVNA